MSPVRWVPSQGPLEQPIWELGTSSAVTVLVSALHTLPVAKPHPVRDIVQLCFGGTGVKRDFPQPETGKYLNSLLIKCNIYRYLSNGGGLDPGYRIQCFFYRWFWIIFLKAFGLKILKYFSIPCCGSGSRSQCLFDPEI